MKSYIIVIGTISICVFSSLRGSAQNDISKTVRANNIITRYSQLNQRLTVGDVITGMPSSYQPETLGNPYWDAHWGKSSLLLYKNDELLEGHLTRYDINSNLFEFKIQQGIRVLDGNKIKNVVWIDSITNLTRYIVNGREYLENEVALSGFLEILVERKISLLKRLSVEILKPDFSPALNVGSKDTRIVKKESYYYTSDRELTLIKSRKSIEPIIAHYGNPLENFIKQEGIKFNSESDLVKLFNHITSLD